MRPFAGNKRRAPSSSRRSYQIDSMIIERLSHDGRGLGNHKGKVTFVEGALPGESHRVLVTEQKRNYQVGKSLALLSEPASERASPICKHYNQCGGCQLQHLQLKYQREHKSKVLLDQLSRAGVLLEHVKVLSVAGAAGEAYRRRARLSVNHTGKVFAGFRARNQKAHVAIEQCPVLVDSLNQLIPRLQALLSEFRSRVIGHVELIETLEGPVCLVRFVARPNEKEVQLLRTLASIQLVCQWPGSRQFSDLDGKMIDTDFHVQVKDLTLACSLTDFVQVNSEINEQLIEQVLELAQPKPQEVWLDLFCGIGNFSFPLAQKVKSVVGVEAVDVMVIKAQKNAQTLGVGNVQFMAVDLYDAAQLARLPTQVDGILLDPPRAGAKILAEKIATINPQKIVYISCDVATFSRDAALLVAQGYVLKLLQAHDMFPHTSHVETLAVFEKC